MRILAYLLALLTFASAQSLVIPPDARYIKCSEDIGQVVQQGGEGSVYTLEPCVHRPKTNIVLEGETLIGMYGAVISGSDIAQPKREGSYYVIGNQTQQGRRYYTRDGWRICNEGDLACAAPESVYANGQPLVRVKTLKDVVLGTFFWDYDADKIYLSKDQKPSLYEITVTREQTGALITAIDSQLINVNVREVGNDLNTQVVRLLGDSSLTSSSLSYVGGVGVTATGSITVEGSTLLGCGRICFVAVSCDGCTVIDNHFYYSNYKGTNPNFEGGDTKTVRSVGLSYLGNTSWYSGGYGLWYDGNTSESMVIGNSVYYASKAAIINEITGSALIKGNYVEGSGAGIYISSSRDTTAQDNILVYNNSAMQATDYCRTLSGEPMPLLNGKFIDNTVIQRSHSGPASEWPNGKAAIVNASSSCGFWDVSGVEWFNQKHVSFTGNRYTLEGLGPWFFSGFGPKALTEWLELSNE